MYWGDKIEKLYGFQKTFELKGISVFLYINMGKETVTDDVSLKKSWISPLSSISIVWCLFDVNVISLIIAETVSWDKLKKLMKH